MVVSSINQLKHCFLCEKNEPLRVFLFYFSDFNEYLVYSAFIARTTNCFDELNSSLLCEMLLIMQLTPVTLVCEMKECHSFVTLTVSFLFTIAEL